MLIELVFCAIPDEKYSAIEIEFIKTVILLVVDINEHRYYFKAAAVAVCRFLMLRDVKSSSESNISFSPTQVAVMIFIGVRLFRSPCGAVLSVIAIGAMSRTNPPFFPLIKKLSLEILPSRLQSKRNTARRTVRITCFICIDSSICDG